MKTATEVPYDAVSCHGLRMANSDLASCDPASRGPLRIIEDMIYAPITKWTFNKRVEPGPLGHRNRTY